MKTFPRRSVEQPTDRGLHPSGALRCRAASVLALAALGGALMTEACSSKTSYGYADIHVTIDPSTVSRQALATIVACNLLIQGTAVNDSRSLPCRQDHVGYDVGTVEWTTDTSDSLQFVVRVITFNGLLAGEGTTDRVLVATGKRTAVELKVVGVSPLPESDAATGTQDGGGGAADSADDGRNDDGAPDGVATPAADSAISGSDGGQD